MIDATKTLGTAATFDPERINALLSTGAINNVVTLEKAILSLEYLGQLQKAGLDFIFKGGLTVRKDLSERMHRCGCGLVLDRDLNAAFNILRLGLQSLGLNAVEAHPL